MPHNPIRRPPRQVGSTPRAGAGRAFRGIENPKQVSRRSSQVAPSSCRRNPITRCRAHLDYRYAGTDDEDTGTRPPLDAKHLTLMSVRLRMSLGISGRVEEGRIRIISQLRGNEHRNRSAL